MDLNKYLGEFKGPTLHLIGPFFDNVDLPEEPMVFVDRGVHFRKNSQGFSVGDGDSSTFELDQVLNKEKNFSDLAFVFGCIPKTFTNIHVYGFLGHRKDHEIMNLAEAHTFLSKVTVLTQVSFDTEIIAFSKGNWSVDEHGNFSLFSFAPLDIKLFGKCEYKIEEQQTLRPLSSHGLSNKAHGKIEIQCSSPVFLFRY